MATRLQIGVEVLQGNIPVIWRGYSNLHLQSLCGGTSLDHRILPKMGAISQFGRRGCHIQIKRLA